MMELERVYMTLLKRKKKSFKRKTSILTMDSLTADLFALTGKTSFFFMRPTKWCVFALFHLCSIWWPHACCFGALNTLYCV